MNFDLQKFFIGLTDFFSILFPGALLIYLIKDEVGPFILEDERCGLLPGPEGAAAFINHRHHVCL